MLLFTVQVASGCGGAQVQVAFANTTGSANALTYSPLEYLGIKLLAVYLSEDVTADLSNAGQTPMIYLNPQCEDELESCDVAPGSGVTRVVDDFFDLSRPTSEVNAAINAQAREIPAGTYRYVRIEWCKSSEPVNTVSYRAAGMPDGHRHNAPWGTCNSTAPIPGGLSIAAGDTVTVALGYDLSAALAESPSPERCTSTGYPTCYTDGTTAWELQEVAFIPSASRP